MFTSITSFLSSSMSTLPFRLTGDQTEVVHPSQSVAQGGGLWKHFQAVRVAPGVGGALAAGVAGAAGGGSGVGEACSVFTFDKRSANADQQWLARNALQRLKTLRHPNIVRYVDSVDLPTHLHILTEPVKPLHIRAVALDNDMGQLAAALGLHQICSTLSWLNNDAKLVHSNLHPGKRARTQPPATGRQRLRACRHASELLLTPLFCCALD